MLKELTTIREIFKGDLVGREVMIAGWVRSVRKGKAFSFVAMNDGSTQENFQIVVDQKLANYDEVSGLLLGSSVEFKGMLVKSQGKGQTVEMQATSANVVCKTNEEYPLQKKSTSYEYLREIAHLRPRTQTFGAVFRLRSILSFATHEFFTKRGFYYLHSPIITAVDAEGAGEMFNVTTLDLNKLPTTGGKVDYSQDYFGKKTNLTVSGQLGGECFAMGLGKVYTFGPTFRSENSNTARHLAEFWMIEPEVAFADLDDNAALGADYIKFLINAALTHGAKEMEFLDKLAKEQGENLIANLELVRDRDFVRITYTEAVEIVKKSGQKFEYLCDWGHELQTEHEKYLTDVHFRGPVIVTDYPKQCKAFYMKQNADGKTVRAMDILVPGVGEIIGGSQREDDFGKLMQRVEELKMNKESLWWYFDLRRFGSVPHAGFGLGLERAVMYITGMKNIRDVVPFPRTPKNADF
ncbi:MAG: asparagine--tRNA ligase [Bdellovibrionales bacterium GWA2_49_15]|nr:MAG: asparagine--tRNA ligase [Bdellovibrionales bacterium GWA2_49_15]HAZ13479.1 asparagine--tRNA ligase [Bdellovibrionales bacterium]